MPVIIIDPAGAGGSGTGNVTGPSSATADNLASYNGITGKIIKDSGISADDVTTLTETNWLNGFDLQLQDTNGTLSWDDSTRTFTIDVKSGETEYYYWTNGSKNIETSANDIVIPDVTGTYYIYFDNSAVFHYVLESAITAPVLYQYALVGLVYWNATQGKAIVKANERHGVRMSSATHFSRHSTLGALFDGTHGTQDISGLTSGGTTFTGTGTGHFWDEDIRHAVSAYSTLRTIYRLGAAGEWTDITADNSIAHKVSGDTYYSWNEWDGSTWSLSEGTSSTDYWIMYFADVPALDGGEILKIIGQKAYRSRSTARNNIESDISDMKINGLPSPEITFLYAVIVNRYGKLQTLDDGSLYYDLRVSKGSGGQSSDGFSKWIVWDASRTTDSTITSSSTNLTPGTVIRYKASGGDYVYGVVQSLASDVHTIFGAACTTSYDDVFEYSDIIKTHTETIPIPGDWSGAASSTLIQTMSLVGTGIKLHNTGYLLGLEAVVLTAESGLDKPRLNVKIGSDVVLTTNSNAGIEPAATWINSGTDVDVSKYDFAYGDLIELTTDANGTNNDSMDLAVEIVTVNI